MDKLSKNDTILQSLNGISSSATNSLILVAKTVLLKSNVAEDEKVVLVEGLISNLVSMGCHYSPKMHCIHKRLNQLL